jgi:hypothetical protein
VESGFECGGWCIIKNCYPDEASRISDSNSPVKVFDVVIRRIRHNGDSAKLGRYERQQVKSVIPENRN